MIKDHSSVIRTLCRKSIIVRHNIADLHWGRLYIKLN